MHFCDHKYVTPAPRILSFENSKTFLGLFGQILDQIEQQLENLSIGKGQSRNEILPLTQTDLLIQEDIEESTIDEKNPFLETSL